MKKHCMRVRILIMVQLCGILCSTGCGEKAAAVPELLEPVATNVSYRPVERGDIGEVEVLSGTVVPTDYCSFYETNVTLSKITVEQGDVVKEGQIVAYTDTDADRKQLEKLRRDLEHENEIYALKDQIAQLQQRHLKEQLEKQTQEQQQREQTIKQLKEQLERMKKQGENGGEEEHSDVEQSEDGEIRRREVSEPENWDKEQTEPEKPAENPEDPGTDMETRLQLEQQLMQLEEAPGITPEDMEAQIKTAEENQYYDAELHEWRVKKLEESIAELEKVIADGTLRARHSGSVTYVKNIAESAYAGAYENIIIVSDPDELYLELGDVNLVNYEYEDYEVKYIKKDGRRCDVTEIPYSSEERVLAKAAGRYPNIRLSCPDAGTFIIGEMYPVYYQKEAVTDVLIIGQDSLYQEDDGYFVYVQTEDGNMRKQQITVGAMDENYVEVTGGLSEKELVSYQSDTRLPVNYKEYTVTLGDYEITNQTQKYMMSTQEHRYCAAYSGTLHLAVAKNDTVAAGDLLYVVETSEGKAALTEAQNDINDENVLYEREQKNYEKQLAEVGEADDTAWQLILAQMELSEAEHVYRLAQLMEQADTIGRNNDGTGRISVYAKESGEISQMFFSDSDKVEPDDTILSVASKSKEQLLVQMVPAVPGKEGGARYQDNIADIGEQITVETAAGTYTGHCVAQTVNTNNNKKGYVCSDSNGSYLSYGTTSGYKYPAFYVEMDDPDFYEQMPAGVMKFSYVSMQDIVTLPTSMVSAETRTGNPEKNDRYVWRLVDGELVKQYILVDEKLSDEITTIVLAGLTEGDLLARVQN